MLDLSTGGCRIESPVTVEPGLSLELRIYAPDIDEIVASITPQSSWRID